ncbi:MAG: glycoside hydrolase family 57 protein [Candidatus Woesebacteria bacterium]
MASVCLYFQVHQPLRVKRYRVFDVGNDHLYFNDESDSELNNRKVLEKVAAKSYLPANRLMLKLLDRHPELKLTYSFSGVFLEQITRYFPEVLESFHKLVQTGRVEILTETYYHSLAFFYSLYEFEKQVERHSETVWRTFGVKPKVFRNTELAYNNELAKWAEGKGYRAILAEGWDKILGWRSPNFIYRPKGTNKIKLLLKNYKLSDDIAFRFSEKSWAKWPLTAETYAKWISKTNGNGEVVNLFMDYETFGEHQWEDKGIFEFLEKLPEEVLKHSDNDFVTPSEAVDRYPVRGEIDSPDVVTWADTERDLSAWVGNSIQNSAIENLYGLEEKVINSNDEAIIEDWRRLQISDHFYYMCTKWHSDGDVHKYFNPYESPYDAFISYMNAVKDLELRLNKDSKEEKTK